MKRFALALLALLLGAPAFAQVNLSNLPPSTVVGRSAIGPGPAQALSLSMLSASLFGNTITTTGINILPTANTYNNAINVSQTGPTSGSTAGPIAYNLIQGINSATVTGTGIGQDALNNSNNILLKVRYVLGGANWQGQASAAGQFTASVSNGAGNASSPDAVGLGGSAYINVSNPSTTSGIFGVVPYVYVDNGGSISQAVGSEIDVAVATGGTANQRVGQRIRAQGNLQAAGGGIDAAIVVDNFGVGGSAWKNLITISKNGSGIIPMDATASLFNNDAAITIANVFNSSNLTITGDFANFPNFRISGSGSAKFGSGGSIAPSPVVVQAVVANGGNAELSSSTNTTTGFNGFDANTSVGTANISAIINEPNRTTSRFGVTIGNWAELNTSGSANNGLIIGTITNKPIIFGINSLQAAQITAANFFLGAADAAAPVAQTYSVQNVIAGTSNTAGAALTFAGSKGTGTGSGGAIIWQTAHAGTTGTSQNAEVEDMRLDALGNLLIGTTSAPALGDTVNGPRISILGTSGANTSFGYIQMMNSLVANNSEMGRFTWGSPTFSGADKRTAVIRSLHLSASTVNPTGDIEFFTNNGGSLAQVATIIPSGCLGVGTTTDCGLGSVITNVGLQTVATTVGGLAVCSAALKGMRRFVTDANANTFHTTAAAGGANNVAVVCDGTNWYID